jgi:hypothetical protein
MGQTLYPSQDVRMPTHWLGLDGPGAWRDRYRLLGVAKISSTGTVANAIHATRIHSPPCRWPHSRRSWIVNSTTCAPSANADSPRPQADRRATPTVRARASQCGVARVGRC